MRSVKILPLPGDADSVAEFEIKRAIKRDGRFNSEERRVAFYVRCCLHARLTYSWWNCRQGNLCDFCLEIDREEN